MADEAVEAPQTVKPSFVANIRIAGVAGMTGQSPTDAQLRALGDTITPAAAAALLGENEEITITLAKANDAQAWVPIDAPEPEPTPPA